MVRRLAAKLAAYLLKGTKLEAPEQHLLFTTSIDLFKNKLLTNEERQMLTAMLLDRLGALPLHAKIIVDGTGKVIVNGRSLEPDFAHQLKQAAVAMERNAARKLVRDTVVYMAILDGVHRNINPEMGLFAKAAIWFHQQEDELYKKLAAEGLEEEGDE